MEDGSREDSPRRGAAFSRPAGRRAESEWENSSETRDQQGRCSRNTGDEGDAWAGHAAHRTLEMGEARR